MLGKDVKPYMNIIDMVFYLMYLLYSAFVLYADVLNIFVIVFVPYLSDDY